MKTTHSLTKTKGLALFALLSGLFAASAAHAEVTVTNVTAAQTPGTKEVVITYDVASTESATVTVSLEVKDAGTPIPATSLTGHIGAGVPTGTARSITWNAGADWNDNVAAGVSFNLTADDGVAPPVADGMVLVPGGTAAGITVASFHIGKYEVTWGEWQTVRTWAASHSYDNDISSVGGGSGNDHPVRHVNWYHVVKWCNARSEMEGRTPVYTVGGAIYRSGQDNNVAVNTAANGYRLPTEAEWEYAARGGTLTHGYEYSGSNDLNAVGWYWDNASGAAVNLYSGRGTWPVGQKAENELGLHDMTGNVREWCFDWHPSYVGSSRVFRGGGWSSDAYFCRVAHRGSDGPAGSYYFIGFRVALSSVP